MPSLNDIKPLGAFIENTIRPLLQESSDILFEFQRQGINVTADNLLTFTKRVADLHLRTVIIQAFRDLFIAVLVLWFLCTIRA